MESEKEKRIELMACRLKGHKIIKGAGETFFQPFCFTCLINEPIFNYNGTTIRGNLEKNENRKKR